MNKIDCVLFDFETLSNCSRNGIVLSFAAVKFNPYNEDSLQALLDKTFEVKFNLETQTDRNTTQSTLEWWTKQPKHVYERSVAKSREGCSIVKSNTLPEFVPMFDNWVKESGLTKDTNFFARGCSFDVSYLQNIYRDYYQKDDIDDVFPFHFWLEMDVRTFIKAATMNFNARRLPVDEKLLKGFDHHDPRHDVCKDAIAIQQSIQYALFDKEILSDGIVMC